MHFCFLEKLKRHNRACQIWFSVIPFAKLPQPNPHKPDCRATSIIDICHHRDIYHSSHFPFLVVPSSCLRNKRPAWPNTRQRSSARQSERYLTTPRRPRSSILRRMMRSRGRYVMPMEPDPFYHMSALDGAMHTPKRTSISIAGNMQLPLLRLTEQAQHFIEPPLIKSLTGSQINPCRPSP